MTPPVTRKQRFHLDSLQPSSLCVLIVLGSLVATGCDDAEDTAPPVGEYCQAYCDYLEVCLSAEIDADCVEQCQVLEEPFLESSTTDCARAYYRELACAFNLTCVEYDDWLYYDQTGQPHDFCPGLDEAADEACPE